VRKVNLLKRLPLGDQSIDVCYSSHFLEHIPTDMVSGFLKECHRILVPGGGIRLVMPDLEEICREYLNTREAGQHEKADFVVLELLDQCVRQVTGGQLGQYYRSLSDRENKEAMRDYVRIRTGESIDVRTGQYGRHRVLQARIMAALRSPKKLLTWLQWSYSRALSLLFPPAFRQQNISFTSVGERHMWVYDFHTVAKLLQEVGFVDVEKLPCDRSHIVDFPVVPLDMDEAGQSRKGRESMYIEARRPVL
jgi:SAM-dependent methyltransferase